MQIVSDKIIFDEWKITTLFEFIDFFLTLVFLLFRPTRTTLRTWDHLEIRGELWLKISFIFRKTDTRVQIQITIFRKRSCSSLILHNLVCSGQTAVTSSSNWIRHFLKTLSLSRRLPSSRIARFGAWCGTNGNLRDWNFQEGKLFWLLQVESDVTTKLISFILLARFYILTSY